MNNYKEVSDLLTSFSILVCFNEERIMNRLLDGGIFGGSFARSGRGRRLRRPEKSPCVNGRRAKPRMYGMNKGIA